MAESTKNLLTMNDLVLNTPNQENISEPVVPKDNPKGNPKPTTKSSPSVPLVSAAVLSKYTQPYAKEYNEDKQQQDLLLKGLERSIQNLDPLARRALILADETARFEQEFGNGEYLKKFENTLFEPTQEGNDWWKNELAAANQSYADIWAKGVTKLVGKTGIHFLGNTAGLAYGILNSIVAGDFTKFYDNGFQRALQDQEHWLDDNLKIYMSQREQEMNLWQSATRASFWANDVLGGMSFITGAALSAMATGGSSLFMGTARQGITKSLLSASRFAKTITKRNTAASAFAETKAALTSANAIAKSLDFSKNLLIGAGYEAGVEANDFIDQAKNQLKSEFVEKYRFENNGKLPTEQEIEQHVLNNVDKIYNTGNAVFALNMLLVGGGNALTMPAIFGKGVQKSMAQYMHLKRGWAGLKGFSENVIDDFTAKKIIKESGKWITKYDTWGLTKKGLYNTYKILRNPTWEGFVEEGGQNLIKQAGLNYVKNEYNPFGIADTYTLAESFSEAFASTYGNAENTDFWKEVLIGSILGMAGAPTFVKAPWKKGGWTGSALGMYRDNHEELDQARKFVEYLNDPEKKLIPLSKGSFKAFQTLLSSKELEGAATEIGSVFLSKIAEIDQVFSRIKLYYDLGGLEHLDAEFLDPIQEMDLATFKETFQYDNLSEDELKERKEKVIGDYKKMITLAKEALNEANQVIGTTQLSAIDPETNKKISLNNEDLITAYAYNRMLSGHLDKVEAALAKELEALTAIDARSLIEIRDTNNKLKLSQTWINTYKENSKELKALKNEKEELANRLRDTYRKTRRKAEERASFDARSEVLTIENEIKALESKIRKKQRELNKLIKEEKSLRNAVTLQYDNDFEAFVKDIDKHIDILGKLEKLYHDKGNANGLLIAKKLIDFQLIGGQRQELVQELQALTSREGAKLFSENVETIKQDSFRILRSELIKRWASTAQKMAIAERKADIVEETEDILNKPEEDPKNPTPPDTPSGPTPFNPPPVPDSGDETFDNLNRKFQALIGAYNQMSQTVASLKKFISDATAVKNEIDTNLKEEVSEELKIAYRQLLTQATSFITNLRTQLTKLEEYNNLGKKEPVLTDPRTLIRLIVDAEAQEKLDQIFQNSNLSTSQIYELMSIRKEDFPEADGTPIKPLKRNKSEHTDSPITIIQGDGNGKGYFLYFNGEKIGGITHPDKFRYEGKLIDPKNEDHIKALLGSTTDMDDFADLYEVSKKIFSIIDNEGSISGSDFQKYFVIKKSTPGFYYVANDANRMLTLDFVKNHPEYYVEINGEVGIIGESTKTGLFLLKPDGTVTPLKNSPEAISIQVEATANNPSLDKIRAQYRFYLPVEGKVTIITADLAESVENEKFVSEINEIYAELNEIKRLSKLANSDTSQMNQVQKDEVLAAKQALDKIHEERGTNSFVARNYKKLITLRHDTQSTARLHVDVEIYLNLLDPNDKSEYPEFHFPSMSVKVTSADDPNIYARFSGIISVDAKTGELRISRYENKKQVFKEFNKKEFLDALEERIAKYKYSKNSEINVGDLFYEIADPKERTLLSKRYGKSNIRVIDIKERVETEDVGKTVLASMPRPVDPEKDGYYLYPRNSVFTTKKEKQKQKEAAEAASKYAEPEVKDKGMFTELPATAKIGDITPDGTHMVVGKEKFPNGLVLNKYVDIVNTIESILYFVGKNINPFTIKEKGKDEFRFDIEIAKKLGFDPETGTLKNKTIYENAKNKIGSSETSDNTLTEAPLTRTSTPPTPPPANPPISPKPPTSSKPGTRTTPPTAQEIEDFKKGIDLISKRIKDRASKKPKEDDNPPFSFNNYDGTPKVSMEEALKILQRILPIKSESNPNGIIELKDIEELKKRLEINGVPFGAFFESIIYLDKNITSKGVVYHEAFHAVFRSFLSPSEITRLYAEAKKEYGVPTEEALDELQNQLKEGRFRHSTSRQDLINLWYEEQMADHFAEYAVERENKKTIGGRIKNFFNKIWKWIKGFRGGNRSHIKAFFDDILDGNYRASKNMNIAQSRPAFAMFRTERITEDDFPDFNYVIPNRSKLTLLESERIIGRVSNIAWKLFNQKMQEDSEAHDDVKKKSKFNSIYAIDEALKQVEAFYELDNWDQLITDKLVSGNRLEVEKLVVYLTSIGTVFADKENIKLIRAEVSKILNSIIQDVHSYTEDDTDTPDRVFDLHIGENAGYKTLTDTIKSFFLTSEYLEDEFKLNLTEEELKGYNLYTPINVYHAYYTVQKGLTGVRQNEMFGRLEYFAKYDPQVKAFYDRFTLEIASELNVDPETINANTSVKILRKSNLYNSFVSNFKRTRLDFKEILVSPSQRDFRVISANTKDAAGTQLEAWETAFNNTITGYNKENRYSEIKTALQRLQVGVQDGKSKEKVYAYYPQNISDLVSELDETIDYVKRTLKNYLGMDLHPKYIQYSLVHDNIDKLKKLQSIYEKSPQKHGNESKLKEILKEYDLFKNAGLNSLDQQIEYNKSKVVQGLLFGLIPSREVLSNPSINNRSPYVSQDVEIENGKKNQGGVQTRLRNIAASNAIFDVRIRPTSYQNPEGKTIWDVVHHSFYTVMYDLFKTTAFKNYLKGLKGSSSEKTSTWQSLKRIVNEAGYEYPDHFFQMYHLTIENNPLVKYNNIESLFGPDNVLHTIGGMRETVFTKDGKIDLTKEYKPGKTWKHLDIRSKIMAGMGYFSKNITVSSEENYAYYNFNVNEGKSTTLLAKLPKEEFVFKSTLTSNAIMQLTDLFKSELFKIQIELRNIEKVKQGLIPRIEGYNYNSKTDSYDDSNLRAFKLHNFANLERIDPNVYKSINELIQNPKKKMTDAQLSELLTPYFKEFFAELQNDFLKTLSGPSMAAIIESVDSKTGRVYYSNRLLPKEFLHKVQNRSEINEAEILNFLVNDYINTVSFNHLLEGDSFLGKKDFIDFVKRNAGKIAYGADLGEGQSTIAIIKAFPDDRVKDGVDATDAQSYCTEAWAYNVYLKSLGKAPAKIKEIIKKKKLGERLSNLEIRTLKLSKAMSQSKKIVGKDALIYLKTSVAEIQRADVSYVKPENKVRLKELYDELFLAEENGTKEDQIKIYQQIREEKLWEPRPGREQLHEYLNQMEAKGIDILAFDSAIKEAKLNVSEISEDGNVEMIPNIINNEFLREQVITDGFKNNIVHGSQLLQLIWSEQNPNTLVTFKGKEVKLGAVQEMFKQLLANRIQNGVRTLESVLFEKAKDGKLTKPVYDELYKSFNKSLQASNPNPFLVELFTTDVEGNPVYNPNFTGVSNKFFQMFLAFVSKDVLRHKVKGTKYTLQSDFGYSILEDPKTGKVIRMKDWNPSMKVRSRKLQYDENTGIAECIISEYVAKTYQLKPGEEIPESIAKQLGFRIPTQDKHSMIKLKVVDVISATTMNTIIVHPKVIEFSGADFDIDSLYAHMYNTYGKSGKKFGDYLQTQSIKDAIEEIKMSSAVKKDLTKYLRNTDLNLEVELEELTFLVEEGLITEEEADYEYTKLVTNPKAKLISNFYKERGLTSPEMLKQKNPKLYSDIVNNLAEMSKPNPDLSQIVSITSEELNNILLDLEYELAYNDGNKEIAKTPSNLDILNNILKEDGLWGSLGLDYTSNKYAPHTLMAKLLAIRANDAGNAGIGPAALSNVAFQNLKDSDAKLVNEKIADIFGQTGFFEFGEGPNRVNNFISTLITAMTDNAKHLLSETFNLNIDTIGTAAVLGGLGLDPEFILTALRQPVFTEFSNLLQRNRAPIKYNDEEGLSTTLNNFQELSKLIFESIAPGIELDSIINTEVDYNIDTLLEALKYEKKLSTNLSQLEYLKIQYLTLEETFKAREVSKEIREYTNLLSLIKGLDSDLNSLDGYSESLRALGFYLKEEDGEIILKKLKSVKPLLNWEDIIAKNPYVFEEIKTAFKLKKYLGKFSIAYSDLGQEMMEALKENGRRDSFKYGETILQNTKSLSAFLMSRRDKVTRGDKTYNIKDLFSLELVTKFKELLKHVEDPTHPLYNNAFLKSLSIDKKLRSKSGLILSTLKANTRTVRNKDLHAAILDDFKVLQLIPEYTKFATDLLNHLILKDALQYKNGSYLSNMNPEFFKIIIDELNVLQDAFNNNDVVKLEKLLGMSFEQLKTEFVELSLITPDNYKLRRTASKKTLSKANDNLKSELLKERTSFDLKGLDFIKIDNQTKTITISIEPGVNYETGFKKKKGEKTEDYNNRIKETNDYINKVLFELQKTGIVSRDFFKTTNKNGDSISYPTLGLPLIITYSEPSNNAGLPGKPVYHMYRLESVSEPKKGETVKPLIEGNNKFVQGRKGVYRRIPDFTFGSLFSTMGHTMEDLVSFYQAVIDNKISSSEIEYTEENETEAEDTTEFTSDIAEAELKGNPKTPILKPAKKRLSPKEILKMNSEALLKNNPNLAADLGITPSDGSATIKDENTDSCE